MNDIRVVSAKLDNLDVINALMRASKGYWGYNEAFLSKFMHLYKVTENCLKKGITKLVYREEKLLGYYSFLEHGQDLELDMFFIDPTHIGKGFGKMLWILCCKTMHELGYNGFYLVAEPYANNFYEKMGCIKIGETQSEMAADRIHNIYVYSAETKIDIHKNKILLERIQKR